MVVARRRRRRRPVLPVLALAVTAIVVLLRVASGSSGDGDAKLAWLDEVRPVVAASNQLGAELNDLRGSLGSLDRPSLARRLDRLAGEAKAQVQQADQPGHPSSLRDAHALLISTLAVRARAVKDMKPAVDAALGTAPPADAVRLLSIVGSDLVTADRTYELFRDSAPKVRPGVTIDSKWVPDPAAWNPEELSVWVSSLRSSRAGGPVHDVRIVTVGVEPPPVGKDGDSDVFPLTKNLRLQVVVANVGNEPEAKVTVTAGVGLVGGAPDTVRQFVELAPGQRQVVQLGGLHPPENQPAVITVQIDPVAGETAVSDNHWERRAIFR